MWNIVLGPPGTGKTTYLLNKVEQFLESGIRPEKLGYVAFTKKAANEALTRAIAKFGHDPEKLIYFRTLHSLCYHWLGLKRSDVLTRGNLRDFSKTIGERIGSAWDGENLMSLNTKGDTMLFLENMARNRCVGFREHWNNADSNISWLHFDWFINNYSKFKRNNFLVDYTDMLEMFLESKGSPHLDILIVDEAQDLSTLQWRCVEKLAENVKEIYIAGDDDQAIYRWAGADVEHFIDLKGKTTYLKQSYRVPRKVHDVALGVVKRISNRKEKVWEPKTEEGSVNYHTNFEHVDITKGEWLFLARNNYLLNAVEEYLKINGRVYQRSNKSSVSENLITSIKDWENLRKGASIEAAKVRKIYRYMKAGKGVKRGYKTLKTVRDDLNLSLTELKADHGLLVDCIWHECFDLIGNTQREYVISCLRHGEKLLSSKIRLNTIHASKGGECENVVLLTDLANKTWEELYYNPNNECRAFYVGITRTKDNLHIIRGKTRKEFLFI
jgi:DNA helicase-2/ATP-dependent DNA helicase PcrA|tara:strand:- start:20 stop:1513 length:1494 start_codon:yes stop_codon:yes gene_type:complete